MFKKILKLKTLIFLITIIFISNCAYLNQVKTLKNLQYEVESFQYRSFDLSGVNFELNMKVFNPNKVDVTFERIVYRIFFESKKIGEGYSEKEYILKKNSSGIYSTNLKIKYSILSSDLIEKLKEGKLILDIEGELEVKTKFGKNSFPFKLKKDISKEVDFLKIGK